MNLRHSLLVTSLYFRLGVRHSTIILQNTSYIKAYVFFREIVSAYNMVIIYLCHEMIEANIAKLLVNILTFVLV